MASLVFIGRQTTTQEEQTCRGRDKLFRVDNEEWTLRKILRRFVWHDGIHGKAIVRIMQKQKQLGLIAGFEDPFQFIA